MAGERPEVIINCAASADGRLALSEGGQLRISSEEDMARVHRLRNSVDAILVGIGTVLTDDPKLTVKERYISGEVRQPIRVVLDSKGRTPETARVLDGTARTIIATASDCSRKLGGAEVICCGEGMVDIRCLLAELYKKGVRRVMVEGGGTVIASFIRNGLFDELDIYYGSMLVGAAPSLINGHTSSSENDVLRLKLISVERLGSGVLHRYAPGD